ncbi:MAG: hypothetical protein NTV36_00435, partial [Candidatus Staskawiczbacteria bacterium]|nr:hypothetical protein [Candidatus Staskawiczbacteria bacterium]
MRLEAKPTIFEFVGYRFEPAEKKIFFDYKVSFTSADFVLFTETINLPAVPELEGLPKELYEKVLQDLHLALGISYYKLYCSKKIKTGYVFSQEEANFWNDFYEKGLGEFFYRNKLNPAIFPGFKSVKNKVCKNYRLEKNGKFLLGIGGGKDSVVASELLKNYGANFSTVFIQTQKESLLVDKMLTQIGVESFKIKRHLDEKIFDEAVGYYTGHIPISGVYAFLGILSCIFYGYSYFVVANEFSSNFGNVKYKGRTVNHQWSKSSEFETSFQDYVRKFITPDVFYFSLIRPFYEIRIAEMFAKMENYLYTFSSCNNNFKINLAKNPSTGSGQEKLWCGHCAKCVFVFLMLSPFLPKEKLISIFGKNIFQSEEALGNLRDILGFGKIKPFDCVGTPEEAKVAFYMARETFKDDMAGKAFL